jgi:hypothetical protein
MRLSGLLALLMLAGCADPARNLYEGIQSQRDAARTPMERATTPAPSYDAYRKERDAEAR